MFRASRTSTIAVASIGSGSVSLGIAQQKGGAFALVSGETRALPLEARESAHTASALKDALALLAQGLPLQSVDDLYCVIRAPWSETRIARAKESFEKEQHITEVLIGGLARKALMNVGDKARFLDASVAQVSLNGYPSAHPEGKRAQRVELTALISLCDPAMRQVALQALGQVFAAQKPIFRSGTRATMAALSTARPLLHECVVLDIGEGGAGAIVVRSGIAESDAYVAEGLRSILQRASPQSTPEATLAALAMMARDECSDVACRTIQEGFAKMEPDLVHAFGEFFAKLIIPRRLPSDLVLFARPEIASWLLRFFTRIDFTQFTETAQPFTPTVLTSTDITPGQDTTHFNDIHLAVALALINKETSES